MKIAVIGCGWLGLPLAISLKDSFSVVLGTTTTESKVRILQEYGIVPVLANWNPELQLDTIDSSQFNSLDKVIICIPPLVKKNGELFHVEQIKSILKIIPATATVYYTSSTSVYPSLNTEMNEDFPLTIDTTENKTLWLAEQLILERKGVIIRLGGLCGNDRLLIRHFAGKEINSSGSEPVNLIHQYDAVNAIKAIIMQDLAVSVFNLCAPEHPSKKEFYTLQAQKYSYEPPLYVGTVPSSYKLITTNLFTSTIAYPFKFANPIDF